MGIDKNNLKIQLIERVIMNYLIILKIELNIKLTILTYEQLEIRIKAPWCMTESKFFVN